MKKNIGRLLIILCILMSVISAGCAEKQEEEITPVPAGQSDMEYVESKGTLVVGVTEYAPMGYRERDKWVGFDVELAKAFAKRLEVSVEFKEIEWNDKVKLLENGSIDCIWNGMTMTDELQNSISCSEPYLSNAQVVVLPSDKVEKYQTVEACQHMLFAVEEGSTGEALLKSLKYRYVAYPTQKKAVEGVREKECDAAVIDIIMASCYTGTGHEFENLACGIPLNDEVICVGLRKASDITAELEAFLREAYQDGTIQELARKYGIENAVLSEGYAPQS